MSEDGDREQEVREARLLEVLSRDGEVAQLGVLLKNEPMRDFMWRVLAKCHVFSSVYNRNFGDMALSEGMRQIGLWLLNEIVEADPNALLAMQMKANLLTQQAAADDRQKNVRRARRSAATP